MDRSKKVIFTAHCILNQNSVVAPLARAKGGFIELIKLFNQYDIGIHQIACPEFKHLGLKRKPMTKDEYDTYDFKYLCLQIANETVRAIKEYVENGYQVVGILGINQSPTCSIEDEPGHLIEAIVALLKKERLAVPMIDLPTNYPMNKNFEAKLERLLK
jgi:predicted secreted protein